MLLVRSRPNLEVQVLSGGAQTPAATGTGNLSLSLQCGTPEHPEPEVAFFKNQKPSQVNSDEIPARGIYMRRLYSERLVACVLCGPRQGSVRPSDSAVSRQAQARRDRQSDHDYALLLARALD